MSDLQVELATIKTHLLHHKIVLYGMLVLLVLLTYGIIVTVQSLYATPSGSGTSKNSAVSPQNDYANPFDKDSQYVNPFSEYKNPFDLLK